LSEHDAIDAAHTTASKLRDTSDIRADILRKGRSRHKTRKFPTPRTSTYVAAQRGIIRP
jgi:hypothetical protein